MENADLPHLHVFQTILVAGGWNVVAISYTELLVGTASTWVSTDELPSPRTLRGANVDNRVLMAGGKVWRIFKLIFFISFIFKQSRGLRR